MTETLCTECDAPPGQCNHQAPRYYDQPIRLQPVTKKKKHIGYKVHPDDRERWHAPPIRATPPQKPTEQPQPIQALIIDLENWIDMRPTLEHRIRDLYQKEPLRITRAATAVIDGAVNRRLTNPTGALVTRLNEIQAITDR